MCQLHAPSILSPETKPNINWTEDHVVPGMGVDDFRRTFFCPCWNRTQIIQPGARSLYRLRFILSIRMYAHYWHKSHQLRQSYYNSIRITTIICFPTIPLNTYLCLGLPCRRFPRNFLPKYHEHYCTLTFHHKSHIQATITTVAVIIIIITLEYSPLFR
jgi:hypothetical protein